MRPDQPDLQAFLARVVNGEIQALRVNQGHEVLKDGKEGVANLDSWEQLVNKDPRVSAVLLDLLEQPDFLVKMVLEENQEPMAEMGKREKGDQMVLQVKMD